MTNPLSIDLFTPTLNDGGMENRTAQLANALSNAGWTVRVWVFSTQNAVYSLNDAVEVIDLNVSNKRTALVPLMRAVRENKPEKLISISTPFNALWIIVRMLTGYPKKIAVSERNHMSGTSRSSNKFSDKLRPFIARFLYPRADLVLCVSENLREDLLAISGTQGEKIVTLWNMFNIASIQKFALDSSTILDQFPTDTPVILAVGRMNKQKNHAALINAFYSVKDQTNAKLVILGEGPERPRLTALCESLGILDDVWMPGFVKNPFPWYRRASVIVLPSLFEGLPGVLVEALALGKTTIATDCPGGSAEILDHGKYGIIVPLGNQTALENALVTALSAPLDKELLIERAYEFSIERLLPKTERILAEF